MFYDAPTVIFLTIKKDSQLASYAMFDAGAMAQTLMLAAHGLGLGTGIYILRSVLWSSL